MPQVHLNVIGIDGEAPKVFHFYSSVGVRIVQVHTVILRPDSIKTFDFTSSFL